MGGRVRSSLLAGVVALVVWTVIALLTGVETSVVVTWAAIFFVGTSVLTFAAASGVAAAARRRT